jgi:hypothetical protein
MITVGGGDLESPLASREIADLMTCAEGLLDAASSELLALRSRVHESGGNPRTVTAKDIMRGIKK